ncbi:hypothetical protein COEREDRAFT_81460 [Coemansia reversa NRRL 1564]|uniref:Uncharacterized protein n=1 Tax=Coemansia reversa (strain ATCC 12441 / NRRL 1564) TaxID=763665 RepID=A0A2G5BB77_COERN|nr:hypothetical protein COEREDRAFT_81460 [Coemansia reversa NRRL 1564]|eukprot:PIA16266.1 hypothetical protein COEREDRAFT_81460 [Coemansia reversa NRRL 1564]
MRYYSQKKRGRESIKFPWIWPSEQHQTPPRIWKIYKDNDSKVIALSNNFGNLYSKLFFYANIKRDYMEEISTTMIPVILDKAIEAINNQDYDSLAQLMTSDLLKLYGYALANMKALGYRINIEVVDISGTEMEGIRMLAGPPMAFNASIPGQKRQELFNYLFLGTMHLASPKTAGVSTLRALMGVFNSWIGYEAWFKVKANIKVSLSLNGKVIDEDQGRMIVPLSLSTPHYPSLWNFPFVSKDDVLYGVSQKVEPFQWRLSDIFSIKTHKDLSSMVKPIRETK